MNYETARQLLINQTITEENSDTLLARLQQGKPPVPGQVTSTLLALKVVFTELKAAPSLDKELAFALYKFGAKAQQFFATGRQSGVNWPPLLKEDLLHIALLVESIFSGQLQTPSTGFTFKEE
jgi:hypothetical protein